MTVGGDPKVNNYAIRGNRGASVVTLNMNLGDRGEFSASNNRTFGNQAKEKQYAYFSFYI
jgi:hypothetical protein